MSRKTKPHSHFEYGTNEPDCNMCIYKVRGECKAKSCCCATEKSYAIENGRIRKNPKWNKWAST